MFIKLLSTEISTIQSRVRQNVFFIQKKTFKTCLKHHFFRVWKMVPKTLILSLQFTILSSFYSFWMFLLKFNKFHHRKSSGSFNSSTKNKAPTGKRGIFRPQLLYYDILLKNEKNIPNIEQTIRKKNKKHAKKQVFKTVF